MGKSLPNSPRPARRVLRGSLDDLRLFVLPGGRTRLEGSTWYEIEIEPECYWQLSSDYLIHRIRNRVLAHIQSEVEAMP